MPHKQAVMPLLSSVESPADTIGAVNTIYPAFDRLLAGTNTDAAGFLEPLAQDLAQTHYFRMARIMGTGGAARAIIAALADKGFTLVVAGRDPGKARALLDELAPKGEHHAIDLAHFADPTDFAFDDREACLDLVINASPLGMQGQPPLAFDWSHAPPGSIGYDIVTAPLDTAFLQGARMAGHRTMDGLSMLIGQAAAAFEKFFGQFVPYIRTMLQFCGIIPLGRTLIDIKQTRVYQDARREAKQNEAQILLLRCYTSDLVTCITSTKRK